MPDREFFEHYPLYRKLAIELSAYLSTLPRPPLHVFCGECTSDQTFTMRNSYGVSSQSITPVAGSLAEVRYTCTACNKYSRYFFLAFGPAAEWVMKVGQIPAWDITPDQTISAMLGNHASYYKKGLICESQGYGIAAFAYYRRIVEEIIDQLLTEIAELLVDEDRARYLAALEQTKQTRVTQEKIDLVRDLLPPILRPDGMNPLGVLHHALSEGLHAESDERCIEIAASIRQILVFLTHQVAASRAASRTFTESMRKLLEKKADPKE